MSLAPNATMVCIIFRSQSAAVSRKRLLQTGPIGTQVTQITAMNINTQT